jgi:RHS repeat-associated protein
MVRGTNDQGEESHYIYNGLGYLVANEWVIKKNSYGYTNNNNDVIPAVRVDDVVVCDRHAGSTGQGHINPTGKGHTTGGTTGASPPSLPNNMIAVHKDYTLDYTSALKNVIMEEEHDAGILTYRYVYGLEKAHVVISGIENGASNQQTPGGPQMSPSGPDAAVVEYTINEQGELEYVTEAGFYLSEIMESYSYPSGAGGGGGMMLFSAPGNKDVVKLQYHHDRLGTIDFLSDNVAGKIICYDTHDDWGARGGKQVLSLDNGKRELDLANEYTVHPYDMVLGAYFAQARMYDAADRRFMAVDPFKGYIVNPAMLVQYLYVLDNPILYIDPTGQQREAGYYTINGVYGWYSDPDASQYGKESHTYRIINDLSNRWFATNDAIERRRLQDLANYVRRFACSETKLIYAQEVIDAQLRYNLAVTILNIWQLNTFAVVQRIPSQIVSKRLWFADMVRPGGLWDYKTQEGWKYNGSEFKGKAIEEDWERGILQYMYYDGMFVSSADFGNINYGYTGLAAGFAQTEIYLWGGVIHQVTAPGRGEIPSLANWDTYFDDVHDHEMITLGMSKYLD